MSHVVCGSAHFAQTHMYLVAKRARMHSSSTMAIILVHLHSRAHKEEVHGSCTTRIVHPYTRRAYKHMRIFSYLWLRPLVRSFTFCAFTYLSSICLSPKRHRGAYIKSLWKSVRRGSNELVCVHNIKLWQSLRNCTLWRAYVHVQTLRRTHPSSLLQCTTTRAAQKIPYQTNDVSLLWQDWKKTQYYCTLMSRNRAHGWSLLSVRDAHFTKLSSDLPFVSLRRDNGRNICMYVYFFKLRHRASEATAHWKETEERNALQQQQQRSSRARLRCTTQPFAQPQ